MSKRIKRLLLLLPGGLAVSLWAFKPDPNDNAFEIAKNLDIFATLYKEVNTYYVDEVNPSTLMQTGIEAMLKSLDPYTNYISEDRIEDYRTMTTGEYGGIGVTFRKHHDKVVVTMPYEVAPAIKAGLSVGDEIVAVDEVPLKGKSYTEISKLLKGQVNTNIKLLVKKYGETTTQEIETKRVKVKINNVPYFGMVTSDIGYIQLSDFTSNASQEVKQALSTLKGKGAKSIILDLRGNPGGLLNEAVNICNIFIPKELEVVSTKGKIKEWNRTYRALNQPIDTKIPLAILTNNRSASAAEIVSGVLQDYDRGVLIGQRSFGKGLVQATRPLSYNSQLKVTTAKYYIPSGRCIQALDYSNKDELGNAARIPDSLRRTFRTKLGRKVYDGAGLEPDIILEQDMLAPITKSLIKKGFIFDYANLYASKKPSIADAKTFQLTDAEYQAFVSWLEGKDYDYVTGSEKSLEEIVEVAKEEKYYDAISTEIDHLKKRIYHNKEADLSTFKEEVREALEREIAIRYYYEKGAVEANFDDDQEIREAIELLSDADRYKKVLSNP
ncbi:MAG: S41 family peptidase [Thermonemataceae bacterium]